MTTSGDYIDPYLQLRTPSGAAWFHDAMRFRRRRLGPWMIFGLGVVVGQLSAYLFYLMFP